MVKFLLRIGFCKNGCISLCKNVCKIFKGVIYV